MGLAFIQHFILAWIYLPGDLCRIDDFHHVLPFVWDKNWLGMLSELHIENFAIISQLELKFNRGLNIFTGETGAGKSIIIDAVEAILGSRADATMVRAGAEKALVEASFEISDEVSQPVRQILEREALLEGDGRLTLGREIRNNGRSIARVNGRNVNVSHPQRAE